ncbi:MAG: EAL domain-containing protein, partial [Proteobacteria bacterium]|nr:EAL domain-containing protein [Pseudomonadota bacterium]
INKALETDSFILYAQAIEPLKSATTQHYELLVRMVDEQGNLVPPGAFLASAERYDLISRLDLWVINKAFNEIVKHPGFLNRINFCSINLSGQSLLDSKILDYLSKRFKSLEIPAEKICFEITETAAIANLNIARNFITVMKDLGCRFALDDFGSGLSSFGYLKNLDVDYLKIDGMFVKNIVNDEIDRAMVRSINEIGQVMGMKTIAEFVENDEIKSVLYEIGVNYVQGYGIGKPVPFSEVLTKKENRVRS